jgi:hypothetical protein
MKLKFIERLKAEKQNNFIQITGPYIAGRNFSKEFPSDAEGVIINETLAKAYGLILLVKKYIGNSEMQRDISLG